MRKLGAKRRVYTLEFKTEPVALVKKYEKPVNQIAADLGINENMLRRGWEGADATATLPRTRGGYETKS